MTPYQKLLQAKREMEQENWDKKCALWKMKYPNGCFRVGTLRDDYYQVKEGELKSNIYLGITLDRNHSDCGFHIQRVVKKDKTTYKVEFGHMVMLDFVGKNYTYDTLDKAKLKVHKLCADPKIGELFETWYSIYKKYKNKFEFFEKYMGKPCQHLCYGSFEVN